MIIFVNTVILSGNLLDDPEISSHETNNDVNGASRIMKKARFRIQFFSSNNSSSDIAVACWGKQAEESEKHLKKGSKVVISGVLRAYENNYEITVKTLSFEDL